MSQELTFSVIIPVWREEAIINSAVDHLRSIGHRHVYEILVIDGHPDSTTLKALDRPGVVKIASAPGRARQMNAGAAQARGQVLVFLHADTKLTAGAFTSMAQVLSTGRVVGGAFDLDIDSRRLVLKIIARAANLRSRLTRIPYGDQGIFLFRRVFEEVGGYPNLPILEDVELMRKLKRASLSINILKVRALTSARRWESEGIFRRTWRNWAIIALYYIGVPPERLANWHRPHDPSTGKDRGTTENQ